MHRGVTALTVATLLLVASSPALAAPGDLDGSFGSGGFVRQVLPSVVYATTIVPAPGGKTYVAGASDSRPFVLRLNPDGAPDPTFGSGGRVSLGDLVSSEIAIAVQSDSAIIVAYSTGSYIRVSRLHPDGSYDYGYSGDFYPPNFAQSTRVSGLALTSDDKAVIAFGQGTTLVRRLTKNGASDTTFGTANGLVDTGLGEGGGGVVVSGSYTYIAGSIGSPSHPAVARLGSDGKLDAGFGTGGRFSDTIGGPYTYGWFGAITLDGAGRPVAVGSATDGAHTDVLIERLAANGASLDSGFSGDGRDFWDSTSTRVHDTAYSVDADSNGGFVVGAQGGFVSVLRWTSSGSLDSNFGNAGVATTAIANSDGSGAALMPDGKIVTSGEGFKEGVPVARFTGGGSPDLSFSGDGFTAVPIGASAGLSAVVAQPDGKVVASGYTYYPGATAGTLASDCLVTRRLPDGTPDPSFGNQGIVRMSTIYCAGVALQPDGAIVVGGTRPSGATSDMVAVRLTPSGQLDSGFGSGGYAVEDAGGADSATAVAVQGDGKIVLAGGSGGNDVAVVRLSSDGSPDPGFGNRGVGVVDLGGRDYGQAIALGADGGIVVAANSQPTDPGPQRNDFAIVRLKADGTPDTGFAGSGHEIVDFGADYEQARGIVSLADGSIVAVGSSGDKAALVRLTPGGAVDSSFGSGGKLLLGFGGTYSYARGIAVAAGGKLVVLGASSVTTSGTTSTVLARLTSNGVLDPGFGSGGKATVINNGIAQSVSGLAGAPDGKYLLAGSDGNVGLLLARVLGDPPPPGGGGGTPAPAPPGGGNAAATPPPGSAAAAMLSKLKLTPSTFRAATKGASIAKKPKLPTGTRVSFTLTAAGPVSFAVERRANGVRKGTSCVAPPKKRKRGAKSCKLYLTLKGSFSAIGKAGANTIRFSGRLAGKRLPARSYRLIAAPSGGVAVRAAFKIVR
jgi:uncharacterized delta-60 repeat protein